MCRCHLGQQQQKKTFNFHTTCDNWKMGVETIRIRNKPPMDVNVITSTRVFFLRIFWCSQSGDHSQNNLAKFGYILDMKVGKILLKNKLKINPSSNIFLATYWNLSWKSGDLIKKKFLKIWRIWGGFFLGPFCSMKNPLCRSKSDFFFRSKFGENLAPVKETLQVCTRVDAPDCTTRRRRNLTTRSEEFPIVSLFPGGVGVSARCTRHTYITHIHARCSSSSSQFFDIHGTWGGDKFCWESKLRCREKALHRKCSLQSGFEERQKRQRGKKTNRWWRRRRKRRGRRARRALGCYLESVKSSWVVAKKRRISRPTSLSKGSGRFFRQDSGGKKKSRDHNHTHAAAAGSTFLLAI